MCVCVCARREVSARKLGCVPLCLDISNNLPLVISIARLQWWRESGRGERERVREGGRKRTEGTRAVEKEIEQHDKRGEHTS